jgi:hypothetical protein
MCKLSLIDLTSVDGGLVDFAQARGLDNFLTGGGSDGGEDKQDCAGYTDFEGEGV